MGQRILFTHVVHGFKKRVHQGGNKLRHGHAIIAQPVIKQIRILHCIVGDDGEGGPCRQCPEEFPNGVGETGRGLLRNHLLGAQSKGCLEPVERVEHRLVRNHDALGSASGPRSVDDVSLMLRQHDLKAFGGTWIVHGGKSQGGFRVWRIQCQHLSAMGQDMAKRFGAQDHRGRRIFKHIGEACLGVRWVQRHISSARLEDRH